MDEEGKTILLWVLGGFFALFILSQLADIVKDVPRGTTFLEATGLTERE
jgi:hypothetical protein